MIWEENCWWACLWVRETVARFYLRSGYDSWSINISSPKSFQFFLAPWIHNNFIKLPKPFITFKTFCIYIDKQKDDFVVGNHKNKHTCETLVKMNYWNLDPNQANHSHTTMFRSPVTSRRPKCIDVSENKKAWWSWSRSSVTEYGITFTNILYPCDPVTVSTQAT